MKDTDKQQILELKTKGLGYKTIAKQLNLPLESITSFFNRMKKSEVEKCNIALTGYLYITPIRYAYFIKGMQNLV